MEAKTEKEKELDRKIARIRKQNEEIMQRRKIIDEEALIAQKNNYVAKTKQADEDYKFGRKLYSDELLEEKQSKKNKNQVNLDKLATKDTNRKPERNSRPNEKEIAWREERRKIDEERIRRQKLSSGSWRREWDADKVPVKIEKSDQSTKNSNVESSTHQSAPANRTKYSVKHKENNHGNSNGNLWESDSGYATNRDAAKKQQTGNEQAENERKSWRNRDGQNREPRKNGRNPAFWGAGDSLQKNSPSSGGSSEYVKAEESNKNEKQGKVQKRVSWRKNDVEEVHEIEDPVIDRSNETILIHLNHSNKRCVTLLEKNDMEKPNNDFQGNTMVFTNTLLSSSDNKLTNMSTFSSSQAEFNSSDKGLLISINSASKLRDVSVLNDAELLPNDKDKREITIKDERKQADENEWEDISGTDEESFA